MTSKFKLTFITAAMLMAAITSSQGQVNDACAGAVALTAGVTVTVSTASATSTGDPVPDCTDNLAGVKGIWYTFTPASSGLVTINTCGSSFDTVVAAFTGACGSLVNLACDDDSPACGVNVVTSSIQFNGVAGTTYRILAGGYGGASGTLSVVANVGAFGLANIAPYQPSGWSDKIVVSRTTGTTTDDSPLFPGDSLYIDWAVANFGTIATTGAFYITLYVDGYMSNVWTTSAAVAPNNYVYFQDYPIGSLSVGTHKIRLVGDSFYAVSESNESDNEYTKTFTVTASTGNHQPVANAQSVSCLKNSTANVTLTASDIDADPLTYTVLSSPTNGNLTGSAPNLVYHPNAGFIGSDAFTFKANDGLTDSVPALVSISVFDSAGLIIIPTFDSTITSDPNAATIMSTINSAIAVYESKYSDPVTVAIKFVKVSSGLGMSSTWITTKTWTSYYNALVADSKTTNDVLALAHIPNAANNPVNGGANITMTTANARSLGLTGTPGDSWDSTISLNTALCNLTRPPADGSKYDLKAVAMHEIDEVLGSISGLGQANPCPVDVYRYSSTPNVRNFTTSGDNAYFSIDGTTDLARYNQNSGGDYGDFWSISAHSPIRVQDAFGTPGTAPDLTVEIALEDVIGWDLVTTVAASAPVIQTVARSGGNINISWSSVATRSYQLQYKTNITTAFWTSLGSPIVASGATTSSSDTFSITNRERYYRVCLLPGSIPPPPVTNEAQGAPLKKQVQNDAMIYAAPLSGDQPPSLLTGPTLRTIYFRPSAN